MGAPLKAHGDLSPSAFSLHQRHSHVVDVRSGGPGEDQAVHGLQGVVGVVILQGIVDVPARCGQRGKGSTVHIAASGIGGAVGAIRAYGEHRAASQPGDTGSGGKGELLIAAAFTVASQMHHCFATCNQGNTAARGARVAHHVG